MIGLDASSQTSENLLNSRECVLNLVSADLAPHVDRLAKTSGRQNLPAHKKALGYRYEKDKFQVAELTSTDSLLVKAPRVAECLVQLEARVENLAPFGEKSERPSVPFAAFELQILKVHAHPSILVDPDKSYIDPDAWNPLIMSFRKFYSIRDVPMESKLAQGNENLYAPWKRKGLAGKLTEWILAMNTIRYKKALKRASRV